jgi:hypothetical protein
MNVSEKVSELGTSANEGLSSVGNIVKETGMNIGEAVGLVKREPWYYFYLKITVAIILLAFIGLNIFTYLKAGVDAITYFLKKVSDPIIKPITKATSPITGPIKKGVTKVKNKIVKKLGGKPLKIEKEQRPLPPRKKLSGKGRDIKKDDTVEKAWKLEKQGEDSDEEDCSDPEPDSDILSEIQNNRKTGWCYIGTDRGYRSCVKIGQQDECLSGKVYQTEAICHDPNLRP